MNNKQFKRARNRKNKKEKFVLKFDENARREYLTGFQKRKLQKKAKAAEKLQEKMKLERKRLKAQTKKFYKNLIQSQKPVPEVSHLLTENIDLGEHCVTVTEITPEAAAQQCSWIGQNQVFYENNDEEKNEEEEEEEKTKADSDDIDGMEILPRGKGSRKTNNLNLKTSKDLRKAIKKKVTNMVKQSKVFRTKSKVAQLRDMKRKRREEKKWRKASKRKERAGSDDD